jgi:hypothetical protein
VHPLPDDVPELLRLPAHHRPDLHALTDVPRDELIAARRRQSRSRAASKLFGARARV